jgi:MFS family permease
MAMAGLQAIRLPFGALGDAVPKGGLLDGLLAAVQAPYEARVLQGGLGNPNFLAELLVLLVPVVVGAACSSSARWLRALGLAVGLAGAWILVLTASRAAFFGALAAAAFAVFVVWLARGRGRDASARVQLGWPVALGAGSLLALAAVGHPLLTKLAQTALTEDNIAARLGNWAVAASAWSTSPVWGVGLGGFAADAPRWLQAAHPAGLSEALSRAQFLEVHNEPLQILLELGLVGLALLVLAAWRWERGLHRASEIPLAWRLGLVAGVLGLGVSSLAGFPGHVAVTAWALALVVAVGIGFGSGPDRAQAELPARTAGPYALSLVVALACAAWFSVARGVGAEWWASHELYLMREVQAVEPRAPGVLMLGEAAADHARIKERVVPEVLSMLRRRREYDRVVAVFQRQAAAGLGFDSALESAQALQSAGRRADALPILREVATHYHPSTRQYRRAARGLARMDQPAPRAAEAEAWRKANAWSTDGDGSQATGTIGGKRSDGK